MNKHVEILFETKQKLLEIVDRTGTQPYDEPMDTHTYERVQTVVQKLIQNREKLRHIVAEDASKKVEKLLVGVPNNHIFNNAREAIQVLENAIAEINKVHIPG